LFESKQLGDGLQLKTFHYAQAQLIEMGGIVNLDVGFCGTKGGYHTVFRKKFIANLDDNGINNETIKQLYKGKVFRVQSRHITTQTPVLNDEYENKVESLRSDGVDSAFSLLFRWCGRMGINSFRFFTRITPEFSVGEVQNDETGINIVTENGVAIHLNEDVDDTFVQSTKSNSSQSFDSVSTFIGGEYPRYSETFYSSIPVEWSDNQNDCVLCLPCSRDTFEPPTQEPTYIDGKRIY
jgi:hypothetical protein